MLELNKVYNMDNVAGMKLLDDECIDLTVTSPPYDNLRTYNGFTWDFEGVTRELYRVTKQGGVVVWVVGDATVNGSETGTSFRQALFFKEIGFNLHDTMIFEKPQACYGSNLCYLQSFEYMFVFSKGRPKSINFIRDRENVISGEQSVPIHGLYKDGTKSKRHMVNSDEMGKRKNIWTYHVGNSNTGHPAVFPERLANDHIISWSNDGNVVLDPFMGSGTTGKMAVVNNRKYIGFEISEAYCKIAQERIDAYASQMRMF